MEKKVDLKAQNAKKILIADDSEMNRSLLEEILGDGFIYSEAADGVEAVDVLQSANDEISLVLLDINMPRLNGFGVLEAMNKNRWIEDTPVIIISAENDSGFTEKAYNLGATDYISRPFDAHVVRRRVQNTLMLYEKQKRLLGLVEKQVVKLQKNNTMMINILSHIAEFKNEESGPHIQHIRIITEIILKALAENFGYSFSQEEISLIGMAAAMHDIGKISIPPEILNKPGRLTPEEFQIMKTHSAIGASMLDALPLYKDEPLVKTAHEICRWHHERWDGRGYPDGLKGEEIPISAQVVALADVYDALTSERVYKKAIPHEEAIRMIKNGECGAFNPVLYEVLDKIEGELLTRLKDSDEDSPEDMRKITAEILKKNEISYFGRSAEISERERKKYAFFASVSNEVLFELTYSPYMLTFIAGAQRLGLTQKIITDPVKSDELFRCCGEENLQKIQKLFSSSTPQNPDVTFDGVINIDGGLYPCQMVARTIWSDGETPELTGAIGKISRVLKI